MRFRLMLLLLSSTNCSSNDNADPVSRNDTSIGKISSPDSIRISSKPSKKLIGKWVRRLKTGKTVIEISDSSNISVYNIANNGGSSDTLRGKLDFDPNAYTPVQMHFPSKHVISFYRWEQDTLIDFDEMGERARYIRSHF